MNELQVKTLTITPAKIEFNFDEIEKELDASLVKYQNLTFTEDSTTDLRKVLAELRKGKQAVDRYRIDTKKQLNEPVVKFEDKCKELNEKFDNAINPLDKQLKEYVQRERDEKLKQCEEIRAKIIKEYELDDEYASQVEILDQYLTKSRSLREVEESMDFQAKNIKLEQDKKAADIEIIKTTVKLANAENNLSLSVDAYVRLLEINDVETIKKQIEIDAGNEVARRHLEEQEKLTQDVATKSIPVVSELPELPFDDLPFGDIEEDKTYRYTITGTPSQFDELETFMRQKNIEWAVEWWAT